LCLHAKDHSVALVVGYIQRGNAREWHKTINSWIKQLKESGEDKTCTWAGEDALGTLSSDGKKRVSRCESNHKRIDSALDIRLVHLWIRMANRTKKSEIRLAKQP
jgi:hypothetical protein